jgi:hypothetical protein
LASLGRLNPDGKPRVRVTLPPVLALLALQPLGAERETDCTGAAAAASWGVV